MQRIESLYFFVERFNNNILNQFHSSKITLLNSLHADTNSVGYNTFITMTKDQISNKQKKISKKKVIFKHKSDLIALLRAYPIFKKLEFSQC